MNTIEKRDFIHSHLHQFDEKIINELYELLEKGKVLQEKLLSRAQKSEKDIEAGRLFSRTDLE